ncbi:MAG: SMC-Scp complex subunit ScpB [Erysipelotrichaceae bacterium]
MEIKKIIEGLLFLSGDEGLSFAQLQVALEQEAQAVEWALSQLVDDYANDAYRAMEIVCYGGTYKFVTKSEIYSYAQKIFADTKIQQLSPAALETLAIVAYKQPLTRVEIEEIRGVGCDMMIRKLLARNLLEEVGRSDAPGRPILYGVTQEFLDSFKLTSIQELPELPTITSNETLFE